MATKSKPSTFAARLRFLRQSKEWTIYRLAKESGVSNQQIVRLEAEADPALSTVEKLARALGVPVGELIEGK